MIGNIDELFAHEIKSDQAKNTTMKVLVSPKEGWEGYVMRVLEVGEEGYTPKHSHPWPHINFILSGEGELLIGEKTNIVLPGSYAYVPDDTIHQFRNHGKGTFRFICIVPERGHKY